MDCIAYIGESHENLIVLKRIQFSTFRYTTLNEFRFTLLNTFLFVVAWSSSFGAHAHTHMDTDKRQLINKGKRIWTETKTYTQSNLYH